ncbi:MAG: DUF1643 domain-containing protein [Eubacteriales bacterium]
MGHVPMTATDSLEILTFEEAMRRYEDGEKPYDTTHWVYVPDFYTEYRYLLGTKGERPLIAVGVNPSTASPDNLDNTLKSVERIALGNGYDSFLMFNVYAQRATDPRHMEREFNETLHRENMAAFAYALSLSDHPAVWAAWGTIVTMRPYLRRCVSDMAALGRQYGAMWYTCGARSKNGGHPHHPLYLRRDALLEPFDPDEYLAAGW